MLLMMLLLLLLRMSFGPKATTIPWILFLQESHTGASLSLRVCMSMYFALPC